MAHLPLGRGEASFGILSFGKTLKLSVQRLTGCKTMSRSYRHTPDCKKSMSKKCARFTRIQHRFEAPRKEHLLARMYPGGTTQVKHFIHDVNQLYGADQKPRNETGK